MTSEEKKIVEYYLERADKSVFEAKYLAKESLWFASVNRLYYACFYAITALLEFHGEHSSKHTDVRSLFNRLFVKTSIIIPETASIYNTLFIERQNGDYEAFYDFDEQDIKEWTPKAEKLINEIKKLLNHKNVK